MQLFTPTIAAQLDLISSLVGIVAAIAISFIIITLVASYYRFQTIVEQAETSSPEEMGASPGDVLRVHLARYLASCARSGTSFTIALIRVSNPDFTVRMDSEIIEGLNHAARRDDITCILNEKTAVLLAESEPEDGVTILSRIVQSLENSCAGLSKDEIRVGMASYPSHGLSGKDLTQIALEGLERTSLEEPLFMAEILDDDDEEDDEELEESVDDSAEEQDDEEGSRGWKDRRKNSILDELTGVLKPSAVSLYMQRAMSDLRRKKQNAALFCIGLNNMEHIARFHGQDTADDVLVGVSKILQGNLRADDLIGRHEKYAFLVLVECSLEEVEIIGRRITACIQQSEYKSGSKKLKTTTTLGVATYPEHGRNLHHLYLAGQKVLDHSRANDIRAYAVYDPKIHDKVPTKPIRSIKSVHD
ncbi:GGDEF domain-containing protein [Pontiellaceae bacterium B1224]|nr:GGDEF domain-containing protein [Pontiellaceae bacterium B1224]